MPSAGKEPPGTAFRSFVGYRSLLPESFRHSPFGAAIRCGLSRYLHPRYTLFKFSIENFSREVKSFSGGFHSTATAGREHCTPGIVRSLFIQPRPVLFHSYAHGLISIPHKRLRFYWKYAIREPFIFLIYIVDLCFGSDNAFLRKRLKIF